MKGKRKYISHFCICVNDIKNRNKNWNRNVLCVVNFEILGLDIRAQRFKLNGKSR